jgi:hypothetical protein
LLYGYTAPTSYVLSQLHSCNKLNYKNSSNVQEPSKLLINWGSVGKGTRHEVPCPIRTFFSMYICTNMTCLLVNMFSENTLAHLGESGSAVPLPPPPVLSPTVSPQALNATTWRDTGVPPPRVEDFPVCPIHGQSTIFVSIAGQKIVKVLKR